MPRPVVDKDYVLIASLPSNSVELARAALEGGADILKVHVNVHHDASGTHFGTLAQERPALEAILNLGAPVGLVVGAEQVCTPEELPLIRELGFHFVDAYAHHLPAWMFAQAGLPRMVAIGSDYTLEEARGIAALGAELLEAAIIPHQGYGHPLTTRDVVRYRLLSETLEIPVVVPTQRAITPAEAAYLVRSVGVWGVMIGAIVSGKEPASYREVTARFRRALDGG